MNNNCITCKGVGEFLEANMSGEWETVVCEDCKGEGEYENEELYFNDYLLT